MTRCHNRCAALSVDAANCGRCGNRCRYGERCNYRKCERDNVCRPHCDSNHRCVGGHCVCGPQAQSCGAGMVQNPFDCRCGCLKNSACNDNNPCTIDKCVNGRCENKSVNDGTICDDKDMCTTETKCMAGRCVGTQKVCPASDQCHAVGACDPQTGLCDNPTAPNDISCNDGNVCTTGDVCKVGVCVGTLKTCPGDQCNTAGTCDTQTGICSTVPKPNGVTCDDGLASTVSDECTEGVCVGMCITEFVHPYGILDAISTTASSKEECGIKCIRNPNCLQWLYFNGGCYLDTNPTTCSNTATVPQSPIVGGNMRCSDGCHN